MGLNRLPSLVGRNRRPTLTAMRRELWERPVTPAHIAHLAREYKTNAATIRKLLKANVPETDFFDLFEIREILCVEVRAVNSKNPLPYKPVKVYPSVNGIIVLYNKYDRDIEIVRELAQIAADFCYHFVPDVSPFLSNQVIKEVVGGLNLTLIRVQEAYDRYGDLAATREQLEEQVTPSEDPSTELITDPSPWS